MVQHFSRQTAAAALVLSLVISVIQAGTYCPIEQEIDPWICTTLSSAAGHRFTLLSCQGEVCQQNSAIVRMPPERGVYDRLVLSNVKNLTLPDRWLERVRVRELQMIDSMLSSNFLNVRALFGQQDFMTSLSLRNSQLYSPLCIDFCPKPREVQEYNGYYGRYVSNRVFPNHTRMSGLGPLLNLRSLDLSHNLIANLTSDSFPWTLIRLETINLSYNHIDIIVNKSLAFMPGLSHVDLSHNRLKAIDREVFATLDNGLQTLDLSWNNLVSLPEDMFVGMNGLKEVDVSYNLLQSLHTDTWKHLKGTLSWLNALGNFFICDCNITWIQDLTDTAEVHGSCASPASLEGRELKETSNLLLCSSSKTSTLLLPNPSVVNSAEDNNSFQAYIRSRAPQAKHRPSSFPFPLF